MKKNVFNLSLGLLLAFSVSSFGAVNIKLNLEKGKTYKIRSVSNQTIQQSMNGQSMTVEQKSRTLVSLQLKDKEKENFIIEVHLDSLWTKQSSTMGSKETDYSTPAKSDDWNTRFLNEFVKPKYIIKVSPSGKVLSIVNFKPIKDALTILMDSVPTLKKDMIQKQMNATFKESLFQTMFEPFFSHLSEKELNVGEKWETTNNQNVSGITIILFNTFTLNGIENGLAKVAVQTEFESSPSTEPASAGMPKMTPEIKGTSSGNMMIDPKTGLVKNSTSKGHIEGPVSVEMNGNTMKLTITMDVETFTNIIE